MARSTSLSEFESLPTFAYIPVPEENHIVVRQGEEKVALMLADLLAIPPRLEGDVPPKTGRGVGYEKTGTRAIDGNGGASEVVEVSAEGPDGKGTVRLTLSAFEKLAQECPNQYADEEESDTSADRDRQRGLELERRESEQTASVVNPA